MKKILGLTLISVTLLAGCSKLLPHRSSDKSKASDPSTSQTTTNQAKEEKTKVLKGKMDEFDVTMTFVYTDVVKNFKMDMLGKINEEIPAGVTPEEFQTIFREAMEDSPEYLEIKDEPVLATGDYNVAHKEIDLANPASNRRSPGFTDEEREGFTNLLAKGFTDTFRHIHGDVPERYTWWAQRSKTSKINNTGWRIDYWLTSNRVADKVTKSDMIDSGARQDHTPIVMEIEL